MTDKERGLAIVEAFRTSHFFEQYYGTTEGETESILNGLTEIIKDIEQEPSEDAISRQAVIDSIHEAYMNSYDERSLIRNLAQRVNELPPVTPRPKTGHWIRGIERHFLDTRTNENVEMKKALGKGYHTYIDVQCSECRKVTIHDDSISYQHCPHCGTRMVEPQESEDEEV